MKRYVVGFAFYDPGRVILMKKNRPEWQIDMLNGIGGKIEDGESPEDAMYREFKEETGVFWRGWRRFVRCYEKNEWEVHFFCSHHQIFEKCATTTDEKIVHCDIVRLNYMMTIPNLQWLIPLAQYILAQDSVIYTYLPIEVEEKLLTS